MARWTSIPVKLITFWVSSARIAAGDGAAGHEGLRRVDHATPEIVEISPSIDAAIGLKMAVERDLQPFVWFGRTGAPRVSGYGRTLAF